MEIPTQKERNEELTIIFKNHLCGHCANLDYYDWYLCTKRDDFDKIYTKEEIEKYDGVNWENTFIPETPIVECSFFKEKDWDNFWCE